MNLSITPDLIPSPGTIKEGVPQDWDMAGTMTHHLVITCHKLCPGRLPQWRTYASVPRLQLKCSFFYLWHTVHFKLTLQMAYHLYLHFTMLHPCSQFKVLIWSTTEIFPCICVSSLPVPSVQPPWTLQPLWPFLSHSVTYISLCEM
jgi:hypothetical protein